MAEIMYDLLRTRKAAAGRFPASRLPDWTDLPSLSRQDLVLIFREMCRIMAEEEEDAARRWG